MALATQEFGGFRLGAHMGEGVSVLPAHHMKNWLLSSMCSDKYPPCNRFAIAATIEQEFLA